MFEPERDLVEALARREYDLDLSEHEYEWETVADGYRNWARELLVWLESEGYAHSSRASCPLCGLILGPVFNAGAGPRGGWVCPKCRIVA